MRWPSAAPTSEARAEFPDTASLRDVPFPWEREHIIERSPPVGLLVAPGWARRVSALGRKGMMVPHHGSRRV